MTQEQKAKAYDEAIERAKKHCADYIVETIFPELKESEDEKIRKALINGFNKLDKSAVWYNGITNGQILAWLEKQGEQKIAWTEEDKNMLEWVIGYLENKMLNTPISEERTACKNAIAWFKKLEGEQKPNPCDGCVNRKGCINCENGELRETEQKPADKVEPKFKVGDWIVHDKYGIKDIDKIVKFDNDKVSFESGEWLHIHHLNEDCKLWNIHDAEDGDVLYINNTMSESIMIYKSFNNGVINKYASYNKFGFEGENYLTLNDGYIIPATKEQRDLLFQKIKEAGYEWDAEKKELKKIEQKPAWSEEDETTKNNISHIIRQYDKISKRENKPCWYIGDCLLWIQNIKDRYAWKPSDDQMNALDDVISSRDIKYDVLSELWKDLKKLREG